MEAWPIGTRITSSSLLMAGFCALKRGGEVVWVGALGAPIEDAECDEIAVCPADYDRIAALSTRGE